MSDQDNIEANKAKIVEDMRYILGKITEGVDAFEATPFEDYASVAEIFVGIAERADLLADASAKSAVVLTTAALAG